MRVLSGIKPTGKLTLGNYIGALKNFSQYQSDHDVFIFIADLHALTLPIDPEELRMNTRLLTAFYLAAGLDPNRVTIFKQSDVSAHAELNAILQNYLYMGELSRMTQFKEKSQNMDGNAIGLGLFTYPVLMASDILLYEANIVPVGEDQIQHIEITRDLVVRFNNRYGKILVMPEPIVSTVGKRIMSLSDPSIKMSKSESGKGDIYLTDDLTVIRKKIMSAVTDSGSEIYVDEEKKPGITNLLTIYAALTDKSLDDCVKKFKDYRYGDFKKEVANVVINTLGPFQEKAYEFLKSGEVDRVLRDGAQKATIIANQTLKKVKEAVGLL
ncbi:MAG: Tryptophan--tRNA ligase [Tenericutes bacterium ADurb.Bin239]|nr:MAG: Tryptophan--tRNA ligase [Tenericutes bacterium ADurb.Bin239]